MENDVRLKIQNDTMKGWIFIDTTKHSGLQWQSFFHYSLIATLIVTFATSFSCAYARHVWQLILARSILGASTVACFFTGFVLLTEYVTPGYRAWTSNAYVASLTTSFLIMDLWAWFERRWRMLVMQTSLMSLCAFVVLVFLPESPR